MFYHTYSYHAQAFHDTAWSLVNAHMEKAYPTFAFKTIHLASKLPAKLSPWLNKVFSAGGLRRVDNEATVMFVNLPTMGVPPAAKVDWVMNYVTTMLNENPRNAVAIFVHANRAMDQDKTIKFRSWQRGICLAFADFQLGKATRGAWHDVTIPNCSEEPAQQHQLPLPLPQLRPLLPHSASTTSTATTTATATTTMTTTATTTTATTTAQDYYCY